MKVHTITAADALDAIDRAARAPTWKVPASRNGEKSFTATATFADAAALARTGWSEGRARVQRATAAIAAATKSAQAPAFVLDVAGAFPNAAIAAAGDPACMWTPEPVELSRRPAIRLSFEAAYSCAYKTHEVENFGSAIAAYVDAAEDAGFRVELTAMFNIKAFNGDRFIIRIPVKQAEDALDMDRVAFMAAHPSSFRRIGFGLMETIKSAETAFCGNYGTPTQPRAEDLDEGEIYLPGLNTMRPGSPELADPVRTFRTIGPVIERLLSDRDAPVPPLAFAGDNDEPDA